MKKTPQLVFLLLLGAGCSASPATRESIDDPGQLLFNGYVHESVDCYACHGGAGTGTWKGANLVGIGAREDRAEIEKSIRSGPGIMPAYEGKLTAVEMNEIIDWLETLK